MLPWEISCPPSGPFLNMYSPLSLSLSGRPLARHGGLLGASLVAYWVLLRMGWGWGLGGAGYLSGTAGVEGWLPAPRGYESARASPSRQMLRRGWELGWRGFLGTFLEEDLGTGCRPEPVPQPTSLCPAQQIPCPCFAQLTLQTREARPHLPTPASPKHLLGHSRGWAAAARLPSHPLQRGQQGL